MTLTREELDEQLSGIAHRVAIHGVRAEATAGLPPKEAISELKQLIRDCIEAVTPAKTEEIGLDVLAKDPDLARRVHFTRGENFLIERVRRNTKELLR